MGRLRTRHSAILDLPLASQYSVHEEFSPKDIHLGTPKDQQLGDHQSRTLPAPKEDLVSDPALFHVIALHRSRF